MKTTERRHPFVFSVFADGQDYSEHIKYLCEHFFLFFRFLDYMHVKTDRRYQRINKQIVLLHSLSDSFYGYCLPQTGKIICVKPYSDVNRMRLLGLDNLTHNSCTAKRSKTFY